MCGDLSRLVEQTKNAQGCKGHELTYSFAVMTAPELARRMPSLLTKSGELVTTSLPATVSDVRKHFLERYYEVDQAVVGVSPIVPQALVSHLLSTKKDGALKVKYETGDSITNMEGAMHTVVVPIAPHVLIFGDHRYENEHRVPLFPAKNGHLQARPVIISALVQPDFENHSVLFDLIKLDRNAVGEPLEDNWQPASAEKKANPKFYIEYEKSLKQHMIYHFTAAKALPSNAVALSKEDLIARIREGQREGLFYKTHGSLLSIEMLLNIVYEQQRVEHKLLHELCPNGYAYTWDPPAIFAKTIDSDILDEVWAAAMLRLTPTRLKLLAFNDWNNANIIVRLTLAMHVPVVAKGSLFLGHNQSYLPPKQLRDCALVLHSNSDAFGQNVETEVEFTSLDGALGAKSSLAAHLHRAHKFPAIYL